MAQPLVRTKAAFGTAPVFLTAISTILGAIMFLRFGWAVGNIGFVGTLAVILIGHAVTIPTAMALAEIATNQRVEGGGEYFIISRSFGLVTGAAIGIALFLSQAISVAFYMIAFAEAFRPVFDFVNGRLGIEISDPRIVSLPGVVLLAALMLTKGADLGVKLLYGVVGVLFVSLVLFFLGDTGYAGAGTFETLIHTIDQPVDFFLVFAICFPAFTGMTAGVGLSGDLRDPRRSIPLGTLTATLTGMVVYVAIAYKLTESAAPADLVADQLIMSKIALWGPIIPIGLACATLSSALGSALVAPRTLQALAADQVLPFHQANRWLAEGSGPRREPVHASMVVTAIAVAFVAMGDVDFVAQIISMFFMVTYGTICLISFLEHFAADPAYRPVFRSRWYVSAAGAAMCFWLMFQMSTPYAFLSIAVMLGLYLWVSVTHPDKRGLASIFQGAIFQMSRQLQVFLQKSRRTAQEDRWRPAVVCISKDTFERQGAFDLLRWLCHRYGFGTYIHYMDGYLSKSTAEESREVLRRLVRIADVSDSNVYVDTLISPSYTTALCQVAQLPGISGKENNLVLFEFPRAGGDGLSAILDNYRLVHSVGFDVAILSTCERGFGYRREIHVWVTPDDYDNAGLMILLAFILLGHREWARGEIKLFAIFPEEELDEQRERLVSLIVSGRLPISANNVELLARKPGIRRQDIVRERSSEADLVIVGFVGEALVHRREDLFEGYDGVANVLFVNTTKEIAISAEDVETGDEPELEEQVGRFQGDPDESDVDVRRDGANG